MYNNLILGGGCAGFQLADAILKNSADEGGRLGILDMSFQTFHKTWCLWTKTQHPYSHLVQKFWKKLRFSSPSGDIVHDLGEWEYQYIPGDSFFDWHYKKLTQNPKVDLIKSRVRGQENGLSEYKVYTDQEVLKARKVYNSLPHKNIDTSEHHFVWQHFVGWFVETEEETFDPDTVLLMDFNVTQKDGAAFVYLLPFSSTSALVEYTVFSPTTWPEHKYETGITEYLAKNYPGITYKITKKERGNIPMTSFGFPSQNKEGAINIGGAAGMIKPTTGYTFRRIMEDTQKLIQGQTGKERMAPGRFAFYDRLLLRIIQENPEMVSQIMTQLFTTQPISRIFRFLDEKTSIAEEMLIFARLPKLRFLQALKSDLTQSKIYEPLPENIPALS